MDCALSPGSSTVRLDCTRTIRGFEYQSGNNFFKDGNHTDILTAVWDFADDGAAILFRG